MVSHRLFQAPNSNGFASFCSLFNSLERFGFIRSEGHVSVIIALIKSKPNSFMHAQRRILTEWSSVSHFLILIGPQRLTVRTVQLFGREVVIDFDCGNLQLVSETNEYREKCLNDREVISCIRLNNIGPSNVPISYNSCPLANAVVDVVETSFLSVETHV